MGKLWTANRRIYIDQFGNVVHERDPSRRTLLVPRGGQIPLAKAIELGLVENPAPVQEEKAPESELPPPPPPDLPPPPDVVPEHKLDVPVEPEPEVKHVRKPPATKHVKGPQETK